MITLDTFTRIGKLHNICEDYIVSGFDPVPYIILADGCSSSKHTDVGARILAHSAIESLKYRVNTCGLESLQYWNYKSVGEETIYRSKYVSNTLGLNISNLDSTLIVSYYINKKITVHMYGDGFIISIDKNGNLGYMEITYSHNAPYYLTYWIDEGRKEIYQESDIIKTKKVVSITLELDSSTILDPVQETLYIFNTDSHPKILISSDGLSSFIHKDNDIEITKQSIITEFTRFKTMKGEFIKRRAKRAIEDISNCNIFHLDDISIGGYHIEENKL